MQNQNVRNQNYYQNGVSNRKVVVQPQNLVRNNVNSNINSNVSANNMRAVSSNTNMANYNSGIVNSDNMRYNGTNSIG